MTLLFFGFIRLTAIHSWEKQSKIEEPRNMLKLALLAHNKIRETHIDTESLTLTPDLSTDAQEYAEQLRLVQTFLLGRTFFYFMKTMFFVTGLYSENRPYQ